VRKLLPILALLVFAPMLRAQCTNNGGTPQQWSCLAGSTVAQIQTAINGSTDGAIITLAAGSYSGGALAVVASHGFTIICATAPPAGSPGGAATVNPCTITSTGTVFGSASEPASGTNSHFYRFSGFQITGNLTGHPPFYFCNQNGCNGTMTQIRIDHNTAALAAGTDFVFGTNGTSGGYYGVQDHNIVTCPSACSLVVFTSQTQASPPSLQLGTIKNWFVEDSSISVTTPNLESGDGCSDGWGSAAIVIRHSTSLNCLWTMHGVTHNGGPYNVEFYNVQASLDSTASGQTFSNGNRLFHHQGAGTFMAFNNVLAQVPGNAKGTDPIEMGHYRDVAGLNGHYTMTGVSVVSGTATYSGTFGSSPSTGWYNMSGFTNAGNNTYINITTANSTTLSGSTASGLGTQVTESGGSYIANFSSIDGQAPQCDGTVTTSPFLDGNRSTLATNRGYPCWRQPGRDVATQNLQPMYCWNNSWSDDGSEAPCNLGDLGAGQPIDYFSAHLQYDRDMEEAVSNLPNNATNCAVTCPFVGTTGMGFGDIAHRPATCTTFSEPGSGVGYFATDVGTQGTLYRCSATNTWTVQYTPFTYPHPLIGGAQANPPVFNPGTGVYGGATTVTISSTLGTVLCWNTSGSPATTGNGSTCTTGTAITTNSGANCVASSTVCGNITVSSSETVSAVAGSATLLDSTVASAVYTISTNGITHIGIGASVHVGTMVLE
jgi:hypothetical protein